MWYRQQEGSVDHSQDDEMAGTHEFPTLDAADQHAKHLMAGVGRYSSATFSYSARVISIIGDRTMTQPSDEEMMALCAIR